MPSTDTCRLLTVVSATLTCGLLRYLPCFNASAICAAAALVVSPATLMVPTSGIRIEPFSSTRVSSVRSGCWNTVTRSGKEQRVGLIGKDFALKGGETVYVERAPMFYIYGEVTRAGQYKVEPNMSVMQAIAAGGGMTPRGSERRLKLRRATADGKWVETDVGLQEAIRADDVIYVREALF